MIVTGRAPDDELHAWYETAALFMHPTCMRRQLDRHTGSHGARTRGDCHAGRRPARQGPSGVNGWLVEPDRADLLTDALTDALRRDRADLARFGRASRDIVERGFAWPVVAARMMDVYHNLLMRRSG